MIKLTERLFVLLLQLFIAGCTSITSYNEISHMRRYQAFTSIEPGVPMEKKKLHISGGYQYAVEKPEILVMDDLKIEGLSTTNVTVTNSLTTSYESQHALNLSLAYAPLHFFSFGLLLGLSCGEIFSDTLIDPVVSKNLFEGSVYFRFTMNLNRFTLGVRPELMLTTVNYHHLFAYDYSRSNGRTEQLEPHFSFRNSLFARASLFEPLAFFLGLQMRTLPFVILDDEIKHDIHIGIYTGVSFYLSKILYIDPYFVFPLPSIFSQYHEPIQTGIRLTLDLAPKPKKNNLDGRP